MRRQAVRSIALMLGTAPWLVLAGIVEGFRAELSQAGLGAVIGVGVSLGLIYWGLVLALGRRRNDAATDVRVA